MKVRTSQRRDVVGCHVRFIYRHKKTNTTACYWGFV